MFKSRAALVTAAAGGPFDLVSAGPRFVCDSAAEQALRAGQIIKRLREFVARGESDRRAENLVRLIEEAGALALVGAKETGAQVSFVFDPAIGAVMVDRIQIQQVILNLVRNAMEAMQEVAIRQLEVSTRRVDPERVEIAVRDTGPGIALEINEPAGANTGAARIAATRRNTNPSTTMNIICTFTGCLGAR